MLAAMMGTLGGALALDRAWVGARGRSGWDGDRADVDERSAGARHGYARTLKFVHAKYLDRRYGKPVNRYVCSWLRSSASLCHTVLSVPSVALIKHEFRRPGACIEAESCQSMFRASMTSPTRSSAPQSRPI